MYSRSFTSHGRTHYVRACCASVSTLQLGGVRLTHAPPVVSGAPAQLAAVEAAEAAAKAAGQAAAAAVLAAQGVKKPNTKIGLWPIGSGQSQRNCLSAISE